jgi:hypothetical protein
MGRERDASGGGQPRVRHAAYPQRVVLRLITHIGLILTDALEDRDGNWTRDLDRDGAVGVL